MRPTVFSAGPLRQFLRGNRIATLPQLKQLLGTEADITVFRKLKELSYRTSYSHRGSFYTLDEIADFDERGLWSFGGVLPIARPDGRRNGNTRSKLASSRRNSSSSTHFGTGL